MSNQIPDLEHATADEHAADTADRSRIGAPLNFPTLLIAVVLSLFAIGVNLPFRYVEVHRQAQQDPEIDFAYQGPSQLPRMAGWPFRYLVRYDSNGIWPASTLFSLSALAVNVVLVVLTIALVVFYIRCTRRNPDKQRSEEQRIDNTAPNRGATISWKRLAIADLLLATLLIAALLGWWRHRSGRHEATRDYAVKLQLDGNNAVISAWIPKFLQGVVPTSITSKLTSIRGVRLENPSDEDVRRAVAIGTLTSFRIGGDGYDLRLLDELKGKIHLTDLRIAGRKIDAATVQTLASLERLDTLNLMRTNITSQTVCNLNNLGGLRRLNLVHSDVVLGDIEQPVWADSIETLCLPRPASGHADTLLVDGWSSLRTLSINDLDDVSNPHSVDVRLTRLPSLESLQLDQLQKFDLTLEDLPKLSELTTLDSHWESRIARGGSVPGQLWLGSFVGADLPGLSDLTLYPRDIQKLQLKGVDHLESLGIGSYRIRPDDFADPLAGIQQSAAYEKVDRKTLAKLLKDLGECDGPDTIDLDAVDLEGADLSPLQNNQRVTALLMANSNVNLRQLERLSPMPQLRHLRISGNNIAVGQVNRVLDTFPNLEQLEADETNQAFNRTFWIQTTGGSEANFRLRNREHLKTLSIKSLDIEQFQSVEISNVPALTAGFDFGWIEEELIVRNAPSLSGISVATPPPPATVIEGVRDLAYFAMGGTTVNDKTIASLRDCQSLKTLTLAYPNITPDGLTGLQLSAVSHLHLPGCPVTDEIVNSWGELSQLVSVDLSDTQITGASIKNLTRSVLLETLILDRCSIEPGQLAPLAQVGGLRELSLAGSQIDPETLSELFAGGTLLKLNLSGTRVSNELLESLMGAGADPEILIFRDCEFDSRVLMDVMRSLPRLLIDPTGSNLDSQAYAALLGQNRIVDVDEYEQQKMFQAAAMSGQNPASIRSAFRRSSVIETSAFAPNELTDQPDASPKDSSDGSPEAGAEKRDDPTIEDETDGADE